MIIWGSKGREIEESSGTFHCPECKRETSYTLKRLGQYFTLYFIPLFQTKELAKFVECSECKTQFKPEVLEYRPRKSPSSANNSDEEHQFSSASELVLMQMAGASMLFEEQLSKMTPEQEKKYLAFELGVIEYFDRTLLRIDSEEDASDVKFFNFLIYYAKNKYGDSSEAVFQLWRALATQGLLLKERELGFESINNQVNPDGSQRAGHFPGRYLRDAVGIEI